MNTFLDKYIDFRNNIRYKKLNDTIISKFINEHIMFFKNFINKINGLNLNISRYYKKFYKEVSRNEFENIRKNNFLINLDNNCWKLSNNISRLNKNVTINVKRSFYAKLAYSYLLTYNDFINCSSDECIYKSLNKFIMIITSDSIFDILNIETHFNNTFATIHNYVYYEKKKFFRLFKHKIYWSFFN